MYYAVRSAPSETCSSHGLTSANSSLLLSPKSGDRRLGLPSTSKQKDSGCESRRAELPAPPCPAPSLLLRALMAVLRAFSSCTSFSACCIRAEGAPCTAMLADAEAGGCSGAEAEGAAAPAELSCRCCRSRSSACMMAWACSDGGSAMVGDGAPRSSAGSTGITGLAILGIRSAGGRCAAAGERTVVTSGVSVPGGGDDGGEVSGEDMGGESGDAAPLAWAVVPMAPLWECSTSCSSGSSARPPSPVDSRDTTAGGVVAGTGGEAAAAEPHAPATSARSTARSTACSLLTISRYSRWDMDAVSSETLAARSGSGAASITDPASAREGGMLAGSSAPPTSRDPPDETEVRRCLPGSGKLSSPAEAARWGETAGCDETTGYAASALEAGCCSRREQRPLMVL